MKKRMAFTALLVLCLLPIFARAEGRPRPAYDEVSGKWGYIDHEGAWAISPRYDETEIFRGDYAAASVENGKSDPDHWGIIDREGNWVVEPRYVVDSGPDDWFYGGLDKGVYYVWEYATYEEDPKMGFFDVRSGFFSGVIYDGELTFWRDSRLVPVYLAGRPCYVDRTNGQVKITLPKDMDFGDEFEYGEFINGYALVFQDDGEGRGHPVILTEEGEFLDLPGVFFYDVEQGLEVRVSKEGLMAARDQETGLLGYYDLNRRAWQIPPRYEAVTDFSESGYASVKLPGREDYQVIDTKGEVLAEELGESYEFLGEYAYTRNRLIDVRGGEAARFPEGSELIRQLGSDWEDGSGCYVSSDGLMTVRLNAFDGEGIMNLQGEWVLPPEIGQSIFTGEGVHAEEGWRFFSEGLQPIERCIENGTKTMTLPDGSTEEKTAYQYRIAYMNTKGEFITDFIYGYGGAFLDGLAYVERGDQRGYINEKGEEVYFWGQIR